MPKSFFRLFTISPQFFVRLTMLIDGDERSSASSLRQDRY